MNSPDSELIVLAAITCSAVYLKYTSTNKTWTNHSQWDPLHTRRPLPRLQPSPFSYLGEALLLYHYADLPLCCYFLYSFFASFSLVLYKRSAVVERTLIFFYFGDSEKKKHEKSLLFIYYCSCLPI